MMTETITEKLHFIDFFSSYTLIIGIFLLILSLAYFHATWITRNDFFNIDKVAWIVEEISLPTRTIIRVFPLTERQMIIASTNNSSQYITNLLREDTTGINIPVFQNDISDLRKHILVVYGPKTSDKNEKLLKHLKYVAGKKCFFSFHKDDSIYDISSGIAELTNFAFALLVTSAIHKLRNNQSTHRSTIFSFLRVLQSIDSSNDERTYRHSIETRLLSPTSVQKNYIKRFFSKKNVKETVSSFTNWIGNGPNKKELVKKYTEQAIDNYCNYAIKTKFFKYKMEITRALVEKYPQLLNTKIENQKLLDLINKSAKYLSRNDKNIFFSTSYIEIVADRIYKKYHINNSIESISHKSSVDITHEDENEINFEEDEILEEQTTKKLVNLIDNSDEIYNPRIMTIENVIYGDFTNRRQPLNTFNIDNNVNSFLSELLLENPSDFLSFPRIPRSYRVPNDNILHEHNLLSESRIRHRFSNNHEISNLSGNNDSSVNQIEENNTSLSQNENILNHPGNRQPFDTPDSDEKNDEVNESNASSEISSEENNDEGNLNETIKLKFLNDEEKIIPFRNTMTVGDLKKTHFKDVFNQRKTVRLIFSGQLCRDDNKRLTYYGIKNGSVVHVHISNIPMTANNSPVQESEIFNTDGQLNIGNNRIFNSENQNLHPSINNFNDDIRIVNPIIDSVQGYIITLLLTCFRWLRRETENENISPNSRFLFLYTLYINFLDNILRYLEIWQLEITRPRNRLSLGEHIRNNFSTLIMFVLLPPIIYFLNTSMTNACMSSGVCGCGQTSSCGCRAKAMAAVIKQCYDETCPPGYSCEKNGCLRNRIYGTTITKNNLMISDNKYVNQTNFLKNVLVPNSKTYKEEALNRKHNFIDNQKLNIVTFQELTDPNFLFKECCKERQLPDKCLEKCNFNNLNRITLHNIFLGYDVCPIQSAAEMQYCAAQGRDHRKCCEIRGVNNTIAGDKCLAFCDQRPGKMLNLDYSYIPCFDVFEIMKSCFYDEVKYHAQKLLMNKSVF
uniref:Ubiquitin-like domain-containing protein n=1 Tax=Strongyloides stercoralis TaxID=6248 RepID=A0A0K0E2K5_STRER